MSRARQQKHSEEVKARMVDIARRIISEEGPEALSIRRITKEMDYSAGIVYHYFENKEAILLAVLQENYREILDSVTPLKTDLAPDEAIRAAFTNYIESALQHALEYKAVMFSSSTEILAFTSVLREGVSEKRPALKMLVSALESGIAVGLFAPCDAQITAQAMWSAMFGLLMRIIVEQDISSEHRARLAQRQIDILLKGISI